MRDVETSSKGFTLVEVLIAVTILLVAAVAFVPLFVYAGEMAETNNRRLIAASLANSEIERIRAMEFTEVGVKGGEPGSTVLDRTDTRTVNGVEYRIERNIAWIAEGADCTEDDGEVPFWDAKYVQIRVSASALNNKRTITETMETIISRSIYQEASPGWGIRICAFRGWPANMGEKVPVAGVKVAIDGPKKTWTSTNNRGAALFFLNGNETGNYTVTVTAPGSMMVMPRDRSFELDVKHNTEDPVERWAKKSVLVEYPCYLDLTVRDAGTKNLIEAAYDEESHLEIRSPFYPYVQRMEVRSPVLSIAEPLWPLGPGETGAYGLSLRHVQGYHDAEGNEFFWVTGQKEETAWNGTFAGPGERLALIAYLLPIPPTPSGDDVQDATGLVQWLNGNSHVVTSNIKEDKARATTDAGDLAKVVWKSGNPQDTIKLNNDNSFVFTASAMYWERNFYTQAHMRVAAELHVFNGWVHLEDKNANKQGELSLFVPDGLGIPGSLIPGGNPERVYGEVHFVEGLFLGDPSNEENLIAKGAYYFPDGARLPEDARLLIPMIPSNLR